MRVYFYGPKTEKVKLQENYELVLKVLKNAQLEVFSNLKPMSLPEEIEEMEKMGKQALDGMDALIIDGSNSDPRVGYLVAYAISQKKPALYLYERGSEQDILKYLVSKNIPDSLVIKNYLKNNLEKSVIDFLKSIKGHEIREVPKIKFTLRITPTIEKYLNFKTLNTKKSKADFLREYIEKMMKLDDEFEKYLKKSG
jgi:hypothetical protein